MVLNQSTIFTVVVVEVLAMVRFGNAITEKERHK